MQQSSFTERHHAAVVVNGGLSGHVLLSLDDCDKFLLLCSDIVKASV
jgi:hypothetical protein